MFLSIRHAWMSTFFLEEVGTCNFGVFMEWYEALSITIPIPSGKNGNRQCSHHSKKWSQFILKWLSHMFILPMKTQAQLGRKPPSELECRSIRCLPFLNGASFRNSLQDAPCASSYHWKETVGWAFSHVSSRHTTGQPEALSWQTSRKYRCLWATMFGFFIMICCLPWVLQHQKPKHKLQLPAKKEVWLRHRRLRISSVHWMTLSKVG